MQGNLQQRGPSSWRIRVFVGRDEAGKERYLERTVRGTEREAQRVMARLVTEVDEGRHVAAASTRFGEVLQRWLEIKATVVEATTLASCRWIANTYVAPALGSLPLDKIRALDLDRFYARLRAGGSGTGGELSPRTVAAGIEISTSSFPSGHATMCAAALGSMAFSRPPGHRSLALAASALVAGAVAHSRAALGKHWAVDAYAGLAVGWLWLGAVRSDVVVAACRARTGHGTEAGVVTVVVVPYDDAWPARYEAEAARLRAVLKSLARRIDHVGSTAVIGLAAKPVVDIQISVVDRAAMQAAIEALEGIGYRYEPIPGFEDYPFLGYPSEPPRAVHVHLCFAGSVNERRHLAVRDLLRRDADARERYAALKLELASRCSREQYIEDKSPFVAALERRALDEWDANGDEPGAAAPPTV